MRRQDSGSSEPALFDLPLVVDPQVASEADRKVGTTAGRKRSEPEHEAEQIELPSGRDEPSAAVDERTPGALLARRFRAGLLDGAIIAAGLAVLLAGASRLGAPVRLVDWPAYLLPALEFSFLYVVFSITFWRRTPGMAQAGLTVGASHGDGVTPGQAVRRWVGGIFTLSLGGLPTLLALRDGRSLADRISGLRTRQEPSA